MDRNTWLSKDDIEWAKAEMKTFRRNLMERLEANPKGSELYCLNLQLFNARVNQQNGAKQILRKRVK
jgi:hypothetical protein